MSKQVLIPIANGSEDIETVTLIDVLRRAEAAVKILLSLLLVARG